MTPGVLGRPQHAPRRLDVAHDHALGDLQADPARVGAGRLDRVASTRSMKSGRVSCRGDMLMVVTSSRSGKARCQATFWRQACSMTQSPDRDDQARLVEHAQELGRAHEPPLGIGPSQQRLDPDQLVVLERHHREVEQPELLALERLAQAALGRAAARGRLHRQREHHRARRAGVVGVLEGDGRVVEQVGRTGGPAVDHGDAGGRRHLQVVGADAERHVQRLLELLGPLLGGRRLDGVAVDDRELGAARAEEALAVDQGPTELVGRGDEQTVADLVAVGVVDGGEAVQLDQHQRPAALALTAARAPPTGSIRARPGSGDP